MYQELSTDQESVASLPPFCELRDMESEWKIVPARKGHCDGPTCCRYGLRCRDFAEGRCPFLHDGEEPGYPGSPFEPTISRAKRFRRAADAARAAATRAGFMEAFPSLGKSSMKTSKPTSEMSYASMAARPAGFTAAPAKAAAAAAVPAKAALAAATAAAKAAAATAAPAKPVVFIGTSDADPGCYVDPVYATNTEAAAVAAAAASGWHMSSDIW